MTTPDQATSHPFPAPESGSVLAVPGHDTEAVAFVPVPLSLSTEVIRFSPSEVATDGADQEVIELTVNLRRLERLARHMGVLPTRRFDHWPYNDTPFVIPPQAG